MLPHERLDQALNRRRLDLRMDWNDVADQIGISPESLRAIRKGRNGPKELTARALDDWLNWEPGSTEALFKGGDPTPRAEAAPPAPPAGAVELTVHVTDEPEPDAPPGGFRNTAERVIWALTEYPWQLRMAQINAARALESPPEESSSGEARTTGNRG